MIAPDYTVIVQIVSFIIFWFLLTKLLFKPFLGLLEEREQRTEGTKAEAAALMEEGERLRSEHDSAIARAEDEGRAIKESILQEARRLRERILSQSREEASRMLAAARQEIQREMRRGRELAAREAQEIARQMAEKVLGRKLG